MDYDRTRFHEIAAAQDTHSGIHKIGLKDEEEIMNKKLSNKMFLEY
jgi:hypothetical protein